MEEDSKIGKDKGGRFGREKSTLMILFWRRKISSNNAKRIITVMEMKDCSYSLPNISNQFDLKN